MAENFDLIFGQSAGSQYAWSESDYQNGWETVGNTPPTAQQFDALQRRSDLKAQELNNALTPLVNANQTDNRQPSTAYSEGDIKYSPLLPTGWFLACTVSGMSSASELVVPSPVEEGDEITDGGVTWKIKKIGGAGDAGDGVPLGAIIAYSANGDLPSGYLLCDGSAVSRTMFADLFAAIGTTYGAGDGSTTFNVPDYNAAERFAQGSTVAGTVKSAGLPNITGTLEDVWQNYSYNSKTGAFADSTPSSRDENMPNTARQPYYNNIVFDASISNPIYGASNTVQPPALTCRYIIKAFDGQTPDSALIDITQYAQELATKANRQLSNLDTANLACHVVVDSYYDSTTGDWWRKYSDGWVEQGGTLGDGSLQNYITVTKTFLVPFADINYTVCMAQGSASSSTNAINIQSKTTTTAQFKNVYCNVGVAGTWMACGIGAQS